MHCIADIEKVSNASLAFPQNLQNTKDNCRYVVYKIKHDRCYQSHCIDDTGRDVTQNKTLRPFQKRNWDNGASKLNEKCFFPFKDRLESPACFNAIDKKFKRDG